MKPSILVGNDQEVAIVEDNVPPHGATTPNLQVNVMPIQEQKALGEDVVDGGSNREHKTLRNDSQILANALVHDGFDLTSCEN